MGPARPPAEVHRRGDSVERERRPWHEGPSPSVVLSRPEASRPGERRYRVAQCGTLPGWGAAGPAVSRPGGEPEAPLQAVSGSDLSGAAAGERGPRNVPSWRDGAAGSLRGQSGHRGLGLGQAAGWRAVSVQVSVIHRGGVQGKGQGGRVRRPTGRPPGEDSPAMGPSAPPPRRPRPRPRGGPLWPSSATCGACPEDLSGLQGQTVAGTERSCPTPRRAGGASTPNCPALPSWVSLVSTSVHVALHPAGPWGQPRLGLRG